MTVILKSIAVDVPNGEGLMQLPHAAQDIISIYANLNFITEHLGEGAGRQAYQETLTNAVAYLLHDDNHCQLNKLLSLAFKEYGKVLDICLFRATLTPFFSNSITCFCERQCTLCRIIINGATITTYFLY